MFVFLGVGVFICVFVYAFAFVFVCVVVFVCASNKYLKAVLAFLCFLLRPLWDNWDRLSSPKRMPLDI